MSRIIAGTDRGRHLLTLAGEATRPSTDRTKEAVFSILQPRLRGARFLDLYAGSGQMGLEALSRGAASALFVENAREAMHVVRQNIARCSFAAAAETWLLPALQALRRAAAEKRQFDLIYVDPPWTEASRQLTLLEPLWEAVLVPGGRLILELDRQAAEPARIRGEEPLKTCHYGRAMVLFYGEKS